MGIINNMASEKIEVSERGSMTSSELQDDSDVLVGDFTTPDGLIAVGNFHKLKRANDAGLALLAMGCPYWVFVADGEFILCVDEAGSQGAVKELEAIKRLESLVGNGGLGYQESSVRWGGFILYWIVLIFCFIWQQRDPISELGRVDAIALIGSGEVWRALTALTLHGDEVHLLSNLVAGSGFMFFVCRIVGDGPGWFLFWFTGFIGNLLNAWVYYPVEHLSIGASTSVFGALGLLTGFGVLFALKKVEWISSLPRWFKPILGGLTILGLLGLGDAGVDVAAHISGFICGVAFGVLLAKFQAKCLWLDRFKKGIFCANTCLIIGAWVLALK